MTEDTRVDDTVHPAALIDTVVTTWLLFQKWSDAPI